MRDYRQRLLRAHKFAIAFASIVGEIADLADAVGRELGDPDWTELGAALQRQRQELRRLAR